MKLTAKLVTTIQSSGADFMIWDEQVRGLALRVRAGGGKSFIVKTRVGSGRNAKQTLLTLGKPETLPLDEARTKARLLVLEAATGSQPVAKVKATPPEECATVGGLCALWLEKGSTRSRQRGRLAGTVRKPQNVAIDRGRINAHILAQ